MVGGDRLCGLGLLGDGGLGAVEFEEQGRSLAIAELCVGIDAAHHDVVEQLDARHGDRGLDHGDRGVHGVMQGVEAANRGRDRLRHGMHLQRDLGDDAERAFRADEHAP